MKDTLRKAMLLKREALTNEEYQIKNEMIANRLLAFLKANNLENSNLLTYLAMNKEVSTTKLLEQDYQIFITKCSENHTLLINKYDQKQLIKHPYGFMESKSSDYYDPKIISAAIIPGVAFDKQGNRLGYGGGYYDRFLVKYPHIIKIALAYDFQLIDEIPIDKYDQKMDYLITESQLITFK